MIEVSLEDEIGAIRLNCQAQWKLGERAILTTHERHYGTVVGFLNKALGFSTKERTDQDRAKRLQVAQYLIGRELSSIERLTVHECSVLIDVLSDPTAEINPKTGKRKLVLSEHGKRIIQYASAVFDREPNVFRIGDLIQSDSRPQSQAKDSVVQRPKRPGQHEPKVLYMF